MTKTQERTKLVLERMIKMCENDIDYAIFFSDMLENGLNDIASEDGFGTEQQCDPRGDGRNGSWHMGKIEGIDQSGYSSIRNNEEE